MEIPIYVFSQATLDISGSGNTFNGTSFSLTVTNDEAQSFTYSFPSGNFGTVITSNELILLSAIIDTSDTYAGTFSGAMSGSGSGTGTFTIRNFYNTTSPNISSPFFISGSSATVSVSGIISRNPIVYSSQLIAVLDGTVFDILLNTYYTTMVINNLLSSPIQVLTTINSFTSSTTTRINFDYDTTDTLTIAGSFPAGTTTAPGPGDNYAFVNGLQYTMATFPFMTNADGSANFVVKSPSINTVIPSSSQNASASATTNLNALASTAAVKLMIGDTNAALLLTGSPLHGSVNITNVPTGDVPLTVSAPAGTFVPGQMGTLDLVIMMGENVVAYLPIVVIVSPNGSFSVSTTVYISCLHGGSLISTRKGLKRLDQIKPGDFVMTGHHDEYARVLSLVSCWITHPGPPHDAVVIESNALGPRRPTHRLIIDPGHKISTTSVSGKSKRKIQWIPAGSLVGTRPGISIGKWTDPIIQKDPSPRYDLVLEAPYESYVANGVMVASRKSPSNAGYHHSYNQWV